MRRVHAAVLCCYAVDQQTDSWKITQTAQARTHARTANANAEREKNKTHTNHISRHGHSIGSRAACFQQLVLGFICIMCCLACLINIDLHSIFIYTILYSSFPKHKYRPSFLYFSPEIPKRQKNAQEHSIVYALIIIHLSVSLWRFARSMWCCFGISTRACIWQIYANCIRFAAELYKYALRLIDGNITNNIVPVYITMPCTI